MFREELPRAVRPTRSVDVDEHDRRRKFGGQVRRGAARRRSPTREDPIDGHVDDTGKSPEGDAGRPSRAPALPDTHVSSVDEEAG